MDLVVKVTIDALHKTELGVDSQKDHCDEKNKYHKIRKRKVRKGFGKDTKYQLDAR